MRTNVKQDYDYDKTYVLKQADRETKQHIGTNYGSDETCDTEQHSAQHMNYDSHETCDTEQHTDYDSGKTCDPSDTENANLNITHASETDLDEQDTEYDSDETCDTEQHTEQRTEYDSDETCDPSDTDGTSLNVTHVSDSDIDDPN